MKTFEERDNLRQQLFTQDDWDFIEDGKQADLEGVKSTLTSGMGYADSMRQTVSLSAARDILHYYPAVPATPGLVEKYPGVNPVGCHTEADMQFAERISRAQAYAQIGAPSAKKIVDNMLELMDPHTKNSSAASVFMEYRGIADKSRNFEMAAVLCPDEEQGKLMAEGAKALQSPNETKAMELFVQGIEVASGIKEGPISMEVRMFYADNLKSNMPEVIMTEARQCEHSPASINMDFANLEHIIIQKTLSDEDNWVKDSRQAVKENTAAAKVDEIIEPYAAATAKRMMDPIRERAEINNLDMNKLMLINGVSLHDRLTASGIDMNNKENVKQEGDKILAAAMMSKQHVEAYVPNSVGELSPQPTQVVKTGYEPAPVKRVVMNGLQRFMNRHGGFFMEKAKEANLYQSVMEGRLKAEREFGDKMTQTKDDPKKEGKTAEEKNKERAAEKKERERIEKQAKKNEARAAKHQAKEAGGRTR